MKKMIMCGLLALLLAACATKAERAAQLARTQEMVAKALADRHYKITVQTMTPRRGGSRPVTPDFMLEVRGDTLASYLPYFGRAYSIPYAGQGKGLHFTERIRDYTADRPKEGLTRIALRVTNEEDSYLFVINVFDNGQATIDLQPREREHISYSGEIDFD